MTHVIRVPSNGDTVQMTHGIEGPGWREPRFEARIIGDDGRTLGTVHNSSLLCLPGGAIRAPEATDEQIIEAVTGDESVY